MRNWHTFDLRPERRKDVSATDQLRELHDEVLAWVATNKTKTIKTYLLGSGKTGAQTWESLGDRVTFAVIRVKLRSTRDATLFKMFFSDHVIQKFVYGVGVGTYDPVLISLVRRAMPKIIASDICGVQPMTGPTAAIYSMRVRYKAATKRAAKHAAARRAARRAKQAAQREADQKAAIMGQLLENTRLALDALV